MAWRNRNENWREGYNRYEDPDARRSGCVDGYRDGRPHSRSDREGNRSHSMSSSYPSFHQRRESAGSGSRDDRSVPRRPPGLRGRDIGLFYRNLSRRNRREASPQTVSLDAMKEQKISRMLGLNTLHESSGVKDKLEMKIKIEPKSSSRSNSGSPISTTIGNPESSSSTLNMAENTKIKQDVDWWADVPIAGMSVNTSIGSELVKVKEEHSEAASSTDEFILVQKKKNAIKEENKVKDIMEHDQDKQDITIDTDDSKAGPSDKYNHIEDSVFKRKFLQNLTGSIESNLADAISKEPPLKQNDEINWKLKESLFKKQHSSAHYRKMLEFRTKLPSYAKRRQILDLVERNQVVVISGETGCGKTTQVGQFILDDLILQDRGSTCHIVCTQPRRISATSVAQRVADERDEVLGEESVGFHIRLERKLPRKQGSIVFCTTGIMLQYILLDPGLTFISHLILDEIHERDVTSDFVITLLKNIIPKRPDLKIILMSATLNSEQFSEYFENCPALNIPGFTFPVREFYLEDVLEMTKFQFPPPGRGVVKKWHKYLRPTHERRDFVEFVQPYIRLLQSEGQYSVQTLDNLQNPESEQINIGLITSLIRYICMQPGDGAILVFLPGWSEISKLHVQLTNSPHFSPSHFLVIPLHSLMPTTVQKSVFDRPRNGVRKIVLATNIAETSITIEDVVYVIDCGKVKMTNFDVEHNISTLKAEWVSLANAKQRKGRAGRVRNGVCYHMYTKCREMTLSNYPLPEMLRTRLEQIILQIKILQIGLVKPFLERVMNPPDIRAVDLSIKMLTNLNALDCDEDLTPLGYHLAMLPMDPQAGKMILMAAIFSCVDPILSIAAALNFKDPFILPLGKEAAVAMKKKLLSKGTKSDHLTLAEAVSQWEIARQSGWERKFCHEFFLASGTLQMISDMKGQLAGYLQEMNFLKSRNPKARDANRNSGNVNLLKAIICSGLYPNVAHLSVKDRYQKEPLVMVRTPEDGRVGLHLRSVNEKTTYFESNYLLYHIKLKSTEILLHDTTMIHPLPLLFFGEGIHCSVKDGNEMIHVNDHIYFKCCQSTANVVKVLRKKLDGILEHKISHPGSIDWNNAEGAILREIIELITMEGCDDYSRPARY